MVMVGTQFDHPRVINEDGSKMKHQVTRVAQGVVYFKALEDGKTIGSPSYVPTATFERWVETGKYK